MSIFSKIKNIILSKIKGLATVAKNIDKRVLLKNKLAYVTAVLLVVSIVLGALAIGIVNSTEYKYYKSQYSYALNQYSQSLSQARLSTNYYMKLAYQNLADSYQTEMNKWRNRYEDLEEKAGALGIASGVVFLLSAGAFVILVKKSSAKTALNDNSFVSAAVPGTDPASNLAQPAIVVAPATETITSPVTEAKAVADEIAKANVE